MWNERVMEGTAPVSSPEKTWQNIEVAWTSGKRGRWRGQLLSAVWRRLGRTLRWRGHVEREGDGGDRSCQQSREDLVQH